MPRRRDTSWTIPLLLLAGVAAAIGYYWYQLDRQPEPPTAAAPPAGESAARPPPGPIHPLAPPDEPRSEDRELVELPPLSDSDGYFRIEMLNVFGRALDAYLSDETIVEKLVATVDNLPRRHVAERLRPIGPVSGTFQTAAADNDRYLIAADNAGRYAPLVDLLVAADPDEVVETYRRYYPLLQQAYVELGYPDAYFNDRVVEVIDHLLTMPEVEEPVSLTRPHVLFEFADPELESMSAGRKLLLRIGAVQRERVLAALAALRERIAAPDRTD